MVGTRGKLTNALVQYHDDTLGMITRANPLLGPASKKITISDSGDVNKTQDISYETLAATTAYHPISDQHPDRSARPTVSWGLPGLM